MKRASIASLFLVWGLGAPVGAQVSFTERAEFGARATLTVAWADFDGDGDQDLAVGNGGDQGNELYVNQGNGTFVQRDEFGAGQTFALVWGDYDNDGDEDMAVGRPGGSTLNVINGTQFHRPRRVRREHDLSVISRSRRRSDLVRNGSGTNEQKLPVRQQRRRHVIAPARWTERRSPGRMRTPTIPDLDRGGAPASAQNSTPPREATPSWRNAFERRPPRPRTRTTIRLIRRHELGRRAEHAHKNSAPAYLPGTAQPTGDPNSIAWDFDHDGDPTRPGNGD
jgi:hypothetical protein